MSKIMKFFFLFFTLTTTIGFYARMDNVKHRGSFTFLAIMLGVITFFFGMAVLANAIDRDFGR